eukprot:TRINITY_DN15892_c0_g1_i1.p1 TRINITY_DN15892_c0_g1~~TRINITY_DN15892_c0_g1_i1.p1  ORF type:complete len:731 (+),score=155.72 TRINITY_DN15892_c0_g1_i1:80-2194(+)
MLLAPHRRQAFRYLRRAYCTGTKDFMKEIDADMEREKGFQNLRDRRLKGEDSKTWDETKEEFVNMGAEKSEMHELLGKATERGTKLFFEDRGISIDQNWVRKLPGTDLYISALTHAAKRMDPKNPAHVPSIMRSITSGVNTIEFSATDNTSVSCFYSALTQVTTNKSVSRTGIVSIGRVGWVTFDVWAEINCVTPDFTKLPNSRELSTYSREFTTAQVNPPGHVSLMNSSSSSAMSMNPQAIGDAMNRKYRFYIPGQPSLDIEKLSEGALFKLSGLITVNKKLGSYWSAADHVLRSQVESILSGGTDCVDVVVIDAVHMVHAICKTDDDIVTYLTEAFKCMETMADEGMLQYYGVESDRLWGGSETKHFIDMRLVMKAAKNAGGEGHRFRLVMQPFNLTERGALLTKMADDYTKTIFDFVKENNLGSITTRPLSTYDHEGREQRYINHARITDINKLSKNVALGFQNCVMMEEAVDRLLSNVVLRPAPELYHFGRSLMQASKHLNNYYMYNTYMSMYYESVLLKCLDFLNESKDTMISKWTSQYKVAYNGLAEAYAQFMQNTHAVRDEKILAGIEGCLDTDTVLGTELSQMATNSVLATNVMQSVSIGMRNSIYVDSMIARNHSILRPVPVSVIGRLFTEPEVSFLDRKKEAKYTIVDETSNMSEDEVAQLSEEQYKKTGLMGKMHLQTDDDDEALPGWVKRQD